MGSEDIEELLQEMHPEFKRALATDLLPAVQATLVLKNGILLEYIAEKDRLWVLCVSGDTVLHFSELGQTNHALSRLVERENNKFLAGLGGKSRVLHSLEDGSDEDGLDQVDDCEEHFLYHNLLQPLERFLGSVAHIFVSPAGALNMLAFETISTPTGKLWIDDLGERGTTFSCTRWSSMIVFRCSLAY